MFIIAALELFAELLALVVRVCQQYLLVVLMIL